MAAPILELSRSATSRVLKHAGGESEVPLHPERVAALNTVDAVYFLGVKPVAEAGSWEMDREHYLAPYRGGVGRVGGTYGTRMPVAESVMAFSPDLILLDAMDGPTLTQMQKIAPVVVITPGQQNLEQHLRDVGVALGQERRAEAGIRWLRRKLELARRDLQAFLANDEEDGRMPKAVVLWPAMRMVRVYDHAWLYDEGLGFERSAPIHWAGSHFSAGVDVMAPEQLADIEAQYVVSMAWGGRVDAPARSELLQRNPLWELAANAQSRHVIEGPVSQWIASGPLAGSLCVNDVVRGFLPPEACSAELAAMLKDRPSDEDLAAAERWPEEYCARPLPGSRGPARAEAPKGGRS